jgi:hypothetical protein
MEMKLYQLADQYRNALKLLADPDLPAEAVTQTLEGLAGELGAKAWNVAAAVLQMEGEAELIRRAAKPWSGGPWRYGAISKPRWNGWR